VRGFNIRRPVTKESSTPRREFCDARRRHQLRDALSQWRAAALPPSRRAMLTRRAAGAQAAREAALRDERLLPRIRCGDTRYRCARMTRCSSAAMRSVQRSRIAPARGCLLLCPRARSCHAKYVHARARYAAAFFAIMPRHVSDAALTRRLHALLTIITIFIIVAFADMLSPMRKAQRRGAEKSSRCSAQVWCAVQWQRRLPCWHIDGDMPPFTPVAAAVCSTPRFRMSIRR